MARSSPIDALLKHAAGLDLGRHALVAGADADPVARHLSGLGSAVSRWARRLGDADPAGPVRPTFAPWPGDGPYTGAVLRLPKARDEAAMTLEAIMSVVAAGGQIVVAGGNDEGIKPFARIMADAAGTVETLAIGGHARILALRRPQSSDGLRRSLTAWRSEGSLPIGGKTRPWVFYPGVFAAGHLDPGTALLLANLPELGTGDRVLDYACGTGPIAAAVRDRQPDAAVVMLDEDTVALQAAIENVPGATATLGSRLAAAGPVRFRAILSNPPLHSGKLETHAVLGQLMREAPQFLEPGGELRVVVQRRVPLDTLLSGFTASDVLADDGRFRVWRGIR